MSGPIITLGPPEALHAARYEWMVYIPSKIASFPCTYAWYATRAEARIRRKLEPEAYIYRRKAPGDYRLYNHGWG